MALLLGADVIGQPHTVALSYVREGGAEHCPDERWVRQAVATRLGFDPFRADSELRLEARIFSSAQGLVGQLVLSSLEGRPMGRRELSSSAGDCMELASAMELAIAIAVDPHHLELVSSPVAPAASTAPAVPPTSQPAPSPLPAEPRPSFEIAGGMGLGIGSGLSPYVVADANGHLEARSSWGSLGVEVRGDFPSTVAVGSGEIRSWVFLGSLVPCARMGRWGACGLVSAGVLEVNGAFPPNPSRASSPLVLAGLRGQTEVALPKKGWLVPFVDVSAVMTRTTVYSGQVAVWSTGALSATAGVRVMVRFF